MFVGVVYLTSQMAFWIQEKSNILPGNSVTCFMERYKLRIL